MKKIFKHDIFIVCMLTLVYAIISFINLGAISMPQTFTYLKNETDYALFEIDEKAFTKLKLYIGEQDNSRQIFVAASNDLNDFTSSIFSLSSTPFSWNDCNFNYNEKTFKYLKVVSSGESQIGELALYDEFGNKINMIALNEYASNLIDEQDKVPERVTSMHTICFDEVFYPKAAYEYINGFEVTEWTHPHLGKLLMALPMIVFWPSQFVYRLMGNIAGILMIPVIYYMAKIMLKDKRYAILAALIMMFDNFHFAQSRIATIDSFLVLFIMLSYLFMYKYIILNKNDKIKTKLWMLLLSGLFMGCSIATKWTGCFAAIGLAITFFANLIKTNIIEKVEFKKFKLNIIFKKGKWSKESTIIVTSCILFFVIIPIAIYLACYIPDINVNSFEDFWNLQIKMYEFHKTAGEHYENSSWYTWFIMKKPVQYYEALVGDNKIATILSLGNPAIWWPGIIAMIYVLVKGIIKRDRESWFIIIAIITALAPHIFIPRGMFMYHYFPVLPFMMLCITISIKDIEEKTKSRTLYIFYIIAIILMFAFFYPITSGTIIPFWYKYMTQWFSTWGTQIIIK